MMKTKRKSFIELNKPNDGEVYIDPMLISTIARIPSAKLTMVTVIDGGIHAVSETVNEVMAYITHVANGDAEEAQEMLRNEV